MRQRPRVRRVRLATGVSVPYVRAGPAAATPVVLLHAWGESWRSFDRLLPLLPGTIRAVAMDLRGHGDADKPAAGYSLAQVAADVTALMDVAGVGSAVLLGSSSGGYVAQQVAVTSPHRVAGLVLVGSPRSLRGRPSFAGEVDRLTDPVEAAWVRTFLAWFPRVHPVPQWYLEGRVRDGARMPAHVWRETLAGLVSARPPPTRPRSPRLPSSCTAPATRCWPAKTSGPSPPPSPPPSSSSTRTPGTWSCGSSPNGWLLTWQLLSTAAAGNLPDTPQPGHGEEPSSWGPSTVSPILATSAYLRHPRAGSTVVMALEHVQEGVQHAAPVSGADRCPRGG